MFLSLRTFVVKATCASVLGSSRDSLWWGHRPVSCAPTGEVHMPSGKTATPEIVATRTAQSLSDTLPQRLASTRCTSSTWAATFLVSRVPCRCRAAPQNCRSQGGNTREVVFSHSVRCRAVLGGRFADAVWASLQNQAACDPSRSS